MSPEGGAAAWGHCAFGLAPGFAADVVVDLEGVGFQVAAGLAVEEAALEGNGCGGFVVGVAAGAPVVEIDVGAVGPQTETHAEHEETAGAIAGPLADVEFGGGGGGWCAGGGRGAG